MTKKKRIEFTKKADPEQVLLEIEQHHDITIQASWPGEPGPSTIADYENVLNSVYRMGFSINKWRKSGHIRTKKS